MVIEILTPGANITVYRGFLVVNKEKLPIDDIHGIICATPAVTISGQAVVALAKRAITIVFSGADYLPIATILPHASHTEASRRVGFQAKADQLLKESIWRQIVKAKINNQAIVLSNNNAANQAQQLQALAKRADKDSPAVMEAHAARVYWRALLGQTFKRQTQGAEGVNAILNWGYAILRSAVARQLALAGLYPALGLHHHNRYNPMCLADDVMEPFRPLVDIKISKMKSAAKSLTSKVKMDMAEVVKMPMQINRKNYLAENAIRELVISLARVLENGKGTLTLPKIPQKNNAESLSTRVDVLNV